MVLRELHGCSHPGVDMGLAKKKNARMRISLNTLGHRSILHALWRVLVRFGPLPNLEAFFPEFSKFATQKYETLQVCQKKELFSVLLQPTRSDSTSLTRHWTPQTYYVWGVGSPVKLVGDHWCDWRRASKHRFAHLGNHTQERGAGNAW